MLACDWYTTNKGIILDCLIKISLVKIWDPFNKINYSGQTLCIWAICDKFEMKGNNVRVALVSRT